MPPLSLRAFNILFRLPPSFGLPRLRGLRSNPARPLWLPTVHWTVGLTRRAVHVPPSHSGGSHARRGTPAPCAQQVASAFISQNIYCEMKDYATRSRAENNTRPLSWTLRVFDSAFLLRKSINTTKWSRPARAELSLSEYSSWILSLGLLKL